jgi:hypothetical protein
VSLFVLSETGRERKKLARRHCQKKTNDPSLQFAKLNFNYSEASANLIKQEQLWLKGLVVLFRQKVGNIFTGITIKQSPELHKNYKKL